MSFTSKFYCGGREDLPDVRAKSDARGIGYNDGVQTTSDKVTKGGTTSTKGENGYKHPTRYDLPRLVPLIQITVGGEKRWEKIDGFV